MGKIVAIGGGDLRKKSTLPIDLEIIKLTGKIKPKFLFVPTASSDSLVYIDIMCKYYQELGCETDVLLLLKANIDLAAITAQIKAADIIYVGGGNTLKMMRRWRKLGVDKLLIQAYQAGTVLCGVSAGSICWFEGGHSDSLSFYHPDDWQYIRVTGLGLIPGTHCPHYDSDTLGAKRADSFQAMMRKRRDTGIAIDDDCAIIFVDGQYRVISSNNSQAYILRKSSNKLEIKALPADQNWHTINSL